MFFFSMLLAAAKSDQLMEKKRLVAFKHQLANGK